MFRNKLNLVYFAIAALSFFDNPGEGGGGEGYAGTAAARAGETGAQMDATKTDEGHVDRALDSNFRPFCQWVNRHLRAGTFTINYDGKNLKVDELLGDGRVRLLDGGTSIYAQFEGDIIDALLPQIV